MTYKSLDNWLFPFINFPQTINKNKREQEKTQKI